MSSGPDAIWVHNDGKEKCDLIYSFIAKRLPEYANSKTKGLDLLREVYVSLDHKDEEAFLLEALRDVIQVPILEVDGKPNVGKLTSESGAFLEKMEIAYGQNNIDFQAEIRGLTAYLKEGAEMVVQGKSDVQGVRKADFLCKQGAVTITRDVYSPRIGTTINDVTKVVMNKAFNGKTQQAQSVMVDLGIGEGNALRSVSEFTDPKIFSAQPGFTGTIVDWVNQENVRIHGLSATPLKEVILFKNEEIVQTIKGIFR